MIRTFLFIAFLNFALSSRSYGAVIKLQSAQSLKEAISRADRGDTIIVKGGVFKEGNLVIDKPLVLIGEMKPVLDGNKQFEILSIKSDSVTVQGFRIIRSGRSTLDDPGAVKVYECRNVRIIGNELEENFFGIYLQFCKNCLVKDNVIFSSGQDEQNIGNGIHCWKSDSLQIIGNRITGHRDGIYFEFVTGSVIWRNIARNNIRYGLHFMFSDRDAYFSNLFIGNGAGVAVMFTKNVVMMNNIFIDNWGDAAYGLLAKEISDCTLSGNTFRNNTIAIFMDGTNRMNVSGNRFEENGWGMKIQANCMDNVISRNLFLMNTFDVATNGSLTLNSFDLNYWDKYEGYDLDRDGIGDVPYRPLSLFTVLVERYPPVMMLFRSFMVTLLERSEKLLPSITPEAFVDQRPGMHPFF